MADKVRPLKLESSSTGGTQNDLLPTDTDPTSDYLSCKGIAFDGSDSTLLNVVSGNMTFTAGGGNFTTTASATNTLIVQNTSNSATTQQASLQALVGGSSAGDAWLLVGLTGSSQFSFGVDNSDSDKLKIVAGANPSAATGILEITTSGGVVWNEGGAAQSFRVESDTNAGMFFVDGVNNRVGIGTSSPTVAFNVEGVSVFNDTGVDVDFRVESLDNEHMFFVDGGSNFIGIATSSPEELVHINSATFSSGEQRLDACLATQYRTVADTSVGDQFIYHSGYESLVTNSGEVDTNEAALDRYTSGFAFTADDSGDTSTNKKGGTSYKQVSGIYGTATCEGTFSGGVASQGLRVAAGAYLTAECGGSGGIPVAYGIYATATGGTGTNWDAYFPSAPIFTEGGVYIGTNGVTLTDDGDGALIITGNSTGNDENLIINLDDISNEVTFTSTSGVTRADFQSIYLMDAGQKRVGTQYDKTTNTTLGNITNLSVDVVAGRVYRLSIILYYDADTVGGYKFAISGTCTATFFRANINVLQNASATYVLTSRVTSLGSSAGGAGSTAGVAYIDGFIQVNAGGTLTAQFAQNASNGTSSILIGSSLFATDMT